LAAKGPERRIFEIRSPESTADAMGDELLVLQMDCKWDGDVVGNTEKIEGMYGRKKSPANRGFS